MAEREGRLRQALRGPVPLASERGEAPVAPQYRPAWAEVDVGAIKHNVAVLRRIVAPAQLCAVVKADAYGHGAPDVARAALSAGAAGLAVALVEEGVALSEAGVRAPVLLLSEPPDDGYDAAVAAGLTPTVCTLEGVRRAAAAARSFGTRLAVHVKVDTGMHRVGAAPSEVKSLVEAISDDPSLALEGLWTHLAVADGVEAGDREFTAKQVRCFDDTVATLSAAGMRPNLLHAANSAAAIAWPRARYDMVRVGISLYGELPAPSMEGVVAAASGATPLQPAMSLRARVSAVRWLEGGARPSYGRLRPLPERSVVATVPVGYADGVPRALFSAGFDVLIGGRRRPLAGMVTMDQIVVDCGPSGDVAPGDEVVLLGRQGDERVSAAEWADRLGTIAYEVLCGIGPRVPRHVVGVPQVGGSAVGARAEGG